MKFRIITYIIVTITGILLLSSSEINDISNVFSMVLILLGGANTFIEVRKYRKVKKRNEFTN
jgi:positive regulator of sigma E activity